MLCARVGAELRVIPLNPDGTLQLETLPTLFDEKTRLLAITHVSNVLGTENPLAEMITLAHQHGAKVLVDGAQAVMHHPVDVQALDCDFYVFSGHKLYGPTGIGILYVKEALLQEMPPWEGGGSMIATVSLSEGTTWTKAPWRFEAGTPNTGGIIGLGAALEYVSALGLNNIAEYEQNLMHYALSQLAAVPDLTLYGPPDRLGVIAFNLGKHHAYDVGSFLDNYGIAVRTGHHCAMPLMAYYNVPAMCRASLAMYNTHEEVDRLVTACNVFTVCWDNREALWLYCRIKKNCCVIFYAAPTGKRNISTLLSWVSVCQNYVTKTKARKIASRAARVRCGL